MRNHEGRSEHYQRVMHNAWRRSFGGGMSPPHGPIKKGAGRLGPCRVGDRAEYLAKYAISRFAFVSDVQRQEDFGLIDFFCTLGAEEVIKGHKTLLIVPDSSFYVQVKSSAETYTINSRLVKWVAEHVASPFFLCIVNQEDDKVSFYSCSYIWQALTLISEPTQIKFYFDETKFNRASKKYFTQSKNVSTEFESANGKVNILFGKPIFVSTLNKLEKSEGTVTAFNELRPHIVNDIKNIISYRTGRIMTCHLENNETNNITYINDRYSIAERSIIPVLISLLGNYVVSSEEKSKAFVVYIYLKMLGVTIDDICKHFGPILADAVSKLLAQDSTLVESPIHPSGAAPSP